VQTRSDVEYVEVFIVTVWINDGGEDKAAVVLEKRVFSWSFFFVLSVETD